MKESSHQCRLGLSEGYVITSDDSKLAVEVGSKIEIKNVGSGDHSVRVRTSPRSSLARASFGGL